MTYSTLLFVHRKPGLSIAAFKSYWESKHIPLLQSIAGSAFPLSHVRNYIAHVASGSRDQPSEPVVLVGNKDEVSWDGLAQLSFRDEPHFQQFLAAIREPVAAAQIQKDEEMFTDRSKLKVVVLGETKSSMQDRASYKSTLSR
jgi:hypothetical protein